jgi:CheY-like chemotaxis protein/nitrogen-specific signal transduction histidine kinase
VAKPFQGQEGPEVLCWLHNTSAEQAAEQALQQQHRLMQAMADSFPHGSISLVGHDLRFRYTGGQGFALYGLNPSDYIGKHVDRLVIPETLNFIRQHLPQVWQGETCRQDVTWGGHTYEVTLCPVMEEQGPSQEVFIILSQNTNEQRLLIEQLRTNEAILEQITQAARVGGWWLEATTRQVYWSDIAREILEVPDDFEPTVESGFDFCATDEYRELGRQAMDQAIASGKGFELEVPMITGKQRPIWVKVMAQTAKTADGHTRLYGAVYDITPLKEGQQQAESANRAKSAFVAHVSHELRTPLNGVVGFADLLIQTPLDREQQLYARSIHDAATLLLGLINDVLDFAKIEAGKLELHEEATSLRKLVQETGNIVWPLAKDKPVRLQTRIGPDLPPWVMVDAIRLRQVLANLLGNALKFTHEGHVTLQIEALPPTEAGHTVRFSVTDTGIGIAPDRLAHIFDAFSQANASTAKHFGGTGLGLSISNRILQLMGSRLQVRSELGKGSTFWFDLLLQPSASVDAYREGGGEPSGPIMLEAFVLVVDDNQVNRSLAMSALRRLMPLARMEAVASGEEALAFMRQQQPDLVFMDIQMPGMNGYDTTRAIRALPNGLKVPIVALTAGTTVGERERCLEAGMNDYATKPVVSATLRHLLLKWMLAMPASQLPKDTHHPPFQFQRLKRLLGPDTHAMDEALATAKRYFDEALLAVKRLEREQATHSLPYLLHDLVEYAQLLDLDELAELSHALLQGQAEPNSIALRRLAQSIGTAQQLLQDA